MVKPRKGGPARRRVVTISIYAGSWLLLSVLSPLWLVLGLVVGVARRRSFIILRLLVFGWYYFGFELMALLLVAWTFAAHTNRESRFERLYWLQA
jgi:hypothetical protein